MAILLGKASAPNESSIFRRGLPGVRFGLRPFLVHSIVKNFPIKIIFARGESSQWDLSIDAFGLLFRQNRISKYFFSSDLRQTVKVTLFVESLCLFYSLCSEIKWTLSLSWPIIASFRPINTFGTPLESSSQAASHRAGGNGIVRVIDGRNLKIPVETGQCAVTRIPIWR